MLQVKKLDPRATVPTVAHPGEDLAYDLFAIEDTTLEPGKVTKVRTGIAVAAYRPIRTQVYTGYRQHRCPDANPRAEFFSQGEPMGLLIRDRSSMAANGVTVSGGVIDAGYRGEAVVMLTYHNPAAFFRLDSQPPAYITARTLQGYLIKAGDKIAQMIPVPVLTGPVALVDELPEASRGEKGFGSSGR